MAVVHDPPKVEARFTGLVVPMLEPAQTLQLRLHGHACTSEDLLHLYFNFWAPIWTRDEKEPCWDEFDALLEDLPQVTLDPPPDMLDITAWKEVQKKLKPGRAPGICGFRPAELQPWVGCGLRPPGIPVAGPGRPHQRQGLQRRMTCQPRGGLPRTGGRWRGPHPCRSQNGPCVPL